MIDRMSIKEMNKLADLLHECKEDVWQVFDAGKKTGLASYDCALLVEKNRDRGRHYIVTVDAGNGGYWEHYVLMDGRAFHTGSYLPHDVLREFILAI